MDPLAVIRSRRSCRSFLPDPIEKEAILEILDAARHAPSGNNVQPWEFVVVTEAQTRQRIAELADYGKFISQAPVCIAVICRDTKYYLEDGSAATQNILLAATALGLGSCWVAGDKKPYAAEVLKLLGVPQGYRLVSLVAIGKAAKDAPKRERRPLEEIVHWERY
ncbi:MAG: nitroreductase family protein [candidate division KSB1 bacterium]|nr:nitroreductase family protein [candidate division KSB1 bacterium]